MTHSNCSRRAIWPFGKIPRNIPAMEDWGAEVVLVVGDGGHNILGRETLGVGVFAYIILLL